MNEQITFTLMSVIVFLTFIDGLGIPKRLKRTTRIDQSTDETKTNIATEAKPNDL